MRRGPLRRRAPLRPRAAGRRCGRGAGAAAAGAHIGQRNARNGGCRMSLLSLILNILWLRDRGHLDGARLAARRADHGDHDHRPALGAGRVQHRELHACYPSGGWRCAATRSPAREDLGTSPLGMIGNVIWLVLAGWWLALGHVVTAVAPRAHHHRHPVRLGAPQARAAVAVADRPHHRERRGRGAAARSPQLASPRRTAAGPARCSLYSRRAGPLTLRALTSSRACRGQAAACRIASAWTGQRSARPHGSGFWARSAPSCSCRAAARTSRTAR